MDDITLDAFMTQLGEIAKANVSAAASSVMRVAERVAKRAKSDYGLKVDDAQYVLKDSMLPAREKGTSEAKGKDRFVESYISTIAKDRDSEVILPEAVILDDYRELQIVLYGHDYSALGMGKNLWVVPNDRSSIDRMNSLIARTVFASAKANPFAEQVYQWYVENMPMGDSIGFIPVEWVEPDDKNWNKIYDAWVKRATDFLKTKGREATDDLLEGIKRIFTKVIMLEYSKVMIPSNPFAVSVAVEKGLLLESQAADYTIPYEIGPELPVVAGYQNMMDPTKNTNAQVLLDESLQKVHPEGHPEVEDLDTKEGRVISAAYRKRLNDTLTILESSRDANSNAIDALKSILNDTEVVVEGAEDIDEKTIELESMTPDEAAILLELDDIERNAVAESGTPEPATGADRLRHARGWEV